MAEVYPLCDDLIQEACAFFKSEYGCDPTHCGIAPGRVNLIGEHTDYNNGFVLPMALPLVTVVVGKINGDGTSKICSKTDTNGEPNKVTDLKVTELKKEPPQWANYVKGVIANFHNIGPLEVGFDAAIVTSVPLGGGVSSSAALEVAFYTLLESLSNSLASDKKQKALACQKAEHDFAGNPCGIMDQFVSIFGDKGHAVFIDCMKMEAESVPLDDPNCAVLITNSNVKHDLATSAYAERRAKCFEAAEILKIPSLRDASANDILDKKDLFAHDEIMYKRFKHVVSEIDRTVKGAEALRQKDYPLFGKFMVESHYSLKDDYEVSCKELDELVELALKCEGVYGSRMTGGGFGGCTVTLVKKEAVDNVIETIKKGYQGTPTFYVCQASEGARIHKL